MTTTTTTLVDFLTARLDEDEAAAEVALERRLPLMVYHLTEATITSRLDPPVTLRDATARYVPNSPEIILEATEARVIFDPARVLREVEAKRRVVAVHAITREMMPMRNPDGPDTEEPEDTCVTCGWIETNSACPTLRALASVYSDHPDYDPDWA